MTARRTDKPTSAKRDDDPFDAFDALFDDEVTAELAKSEAITDRLVEIVQLGIDKIEVLMLDGDPTTQIAALTKILPLATKVADRRQDATLARIADEMRRMFLDIFPDRLTVEHVFDEAMAEEDEGDVPEGGGS